MFQIIIERNAEKDMDRLSDEIHDRIAMAIAGLAVSPRPSGSRKLAGASGHWRICVSDYRVIYDILDTVRIVQVVRVRHRRDVYR